MSDIKILSGTAAAALAGSAGWLDIAEPIATITVTVVVGGATLWYTVERALAIRRERISNGSKKDIKPTGSNGNNDGSMGNS